VLTPEMYAAYKKNSASRFASDAPAPEAAAPAAAPSAN
jgi:hypothetical protein